MAVKQTLVVLIIALSMFIFGISNIAIAQANSASVFGDSNQPGSTLHNDIISKAQTGIAMRAATQNIIGGSVSNSNTTLSSQVKSAIAFDIRIAGEFYYEMIEANSLIAVTKTLIENNPEKIVHIITLGVILYPDYAQEVYNGAALTGKMKSDDILVVAIQAGADPSTVTTSSTVGKTTVPKAAVPLGVGIGGGGSGDNTASSN